MKRNSGIMVTYTLTYPNGDVKEFITDNYVIRDVARTICSPRTIASLDWSNAMGSIEDPKDYILTESSSFFENGCSLEVDSEEIDTEEKRYFNTYASVCEALEELCNQL